MLRTEAFNAMSWHDNHVHGLAIEEGAHGLGELRLDLDYIVEWLACADGKFSFRIAPALLTFHGVSDLVVSLDYAASSAALTPFSIHEIRRTPLPHARYAWEIELNWPKGRIAFSADGFTQALRGSAVESERQHLSAAERRAAEAAKPLK